MRILYLEDFEPDLNLIRQYIGSTGHEFMAASNVVEAAQCLETHQPDVFLVDIIVQGQMAYDLIAYASERQLARHIIAVTAKALPTDRQRYLQIGCSHVLPKPFTIDQLEAALNELQ